MAALSDPVADMFTRIRNAAAVSHINVRVPVSGLKMQIAQLLHRHGYLRGFQLVSKGRELRLRLSFDDQGEPLIKGLKRVSKPGRRVYVGKDKLPRVLGGLGIAIISTSQGIMTDREARRQGIGGEVLGEVW